MKHRLFSAARRSLPIATAIAVILASAPAAFAASGNWTGLGTDSLWTTSGNWSASPAPTGAETATFNGAGNSKTTIDLTGFSGIRFITYDTANAAAYTLGSGGVGAQSFTLRDGATTATKAIVTMNATVVQDQLIDADITLGLDHRSGTYEFINNSTTNTLTVAGDIAKSAIVSGTSGLKNLSVLGSGNIEFSGALLNAGAGAFRLLKSGDGTLTLSGSVSNAFANIPEFTTGNGKVVLNKSGTANALNNGVRIHNGTVEYATTAGPDQIAGDVQLGYGAGLSRLTLNGVSDSVATVSFFTGTSTSTSRAEITTGAGTLTLGNTITMNNNGSNLGATISGNLDLGLASGNRNFTINDSTGAVVDLDISADINSAGGGIRKTNVGGVLRLSGTNSYGGASAIDASGGTLIFGQVASKSSLSTHSFGADSTLGIGVGGAGYFSDTDVTNAFGAGPLSANLTGVSVSVNTNVAIDTSAGDFIYAGSIAGNPTKSLAKYGNNALTLTGTNTYLEGTNVLQGTLVFGNTDSKAPSGTHAFAAGTTLGLGVATAGSYFTATDVTNAFAGSMAGNLSNVTVTATTNVGIDTSAGDFTYSDDVTGSPTKGLAKLGANTLTLQGANTYTGATTITAGKLTLGVTDCLADTTNVLIGTGTLEVGAGFTDTVGTLDCAAAATINLGDNDSKLVFADSNAVGGGDWGGALNITGSFVSGASIKFATSSGLTASQLAAITINGVPGSCTLDGSGFLVSSGGGNTAPTISNVANQSVPSGGNTGALAITVGDAETAVGLLSLSVSANTNTTLVPNANIVFGGSGANRTVTITPVSGLSGTATITLRVTDGGALFAEDSLVLTVTDNYVSWAASQVPPVTGGANGDDNNNGVPNLVEYALVDGGARGVFSGNTLTFSKRGAPYGTDLTYIIETSTDVGLGDNWEPAVGGVTQNASLISYEFTPGPGTPENFARLKVVRTP